MYKLNLQVLGKQKYFRNLPNTSTAVAGMHELPEVYHTSAATGSYSLWEAEPSFLRSAHTHHVAHDGHIAAGHPHAHVRLGQETLNVEPYVNTHLTHKLSPKGIDSGDTDVLEGK